MTGKIIKITVKAAREGGNFHYLFLKATDSYSYRIPVYEKYGNFRRWKPIIDKFHADRTQEIWLTDLLVIGRSGRIIDADSAFRQCEPQPIREKTSTCPNLKDEEFINQLKFLPAYKDINIDQELSKMDGWLLVHKDRKKTRRFIVSWLNRTVDNNSVVAPQVQHVPKAKADCTVCLGTGRVPEGQLKGAQCYCVV